MTLPLLPRPRSCQRQPGDFRLDAETILCGSGAAATEVAQLARGWIREATGFALPEHDPPAVEVVGAPLAVARQEFVQAALL